MAGFILNGQTIGASTIEYIAESYDSTATYAVGDYCVYGGNLYRCTTAVTVAEAFDPTKWTSIVLVEDLVDIIGNLDDKLSQTNTFSLPTTIWEENQDPSTSTDYPYVANISSAIYTNASAPMWDLLGAGSIPTSTERESMNMIMEAYFSSTGVVLYATDEPSVALTLRVRGL